MSEELGEKKSLPTVSDQKASFTVEQWETLPANERSRLVSESSGGELRRQTGDSIEWAPVELESGFWLPPPVRLLLRPDDC